MNCFVPRHSEIVKDCPYVVRDYVFLPEHVDSVYLIALAYVDSVSRNETHYNSLADVAQTYEAVTSV